MLNRCEWKDDIEFIINPTNEKYTAFFTQPWSRQMVEQMYPRRSAIKEIQKIWNAFFYIIKNKIYFGEITFTNGAGFDRFSSYEWDKEMGDKLRLRKVRYS